MALTPINVVMITDAILGAFKVSAELDKLIAKAKAEGRDGISLADLMALKIDNDTLEDEVINSL